MDRLVWRQGGVRGLIRFADGGGSQQTVAPTIKAVPSPLSLHVSPHLFLSTH